MRIGRLGSRLGIALPLTAFLGCMYTPGETTGSTGNEVFAPIFSTDPCDKDDDCAPVAECHPARCVLVDSDDIGKEHALHLVELYRSGQYEEVLEYYSAHSYDSIWIEDHPAVTAGDESSPCQPLSEAALDQLAKRIRGQE